jgi:hypothetical protein
MIKVISSNLLLYYDLLVIVWNSYYIWFLLLNRTIGNNTNTKRNNNENRKKDDGSKSNFAVNDLLCFDCDTGGAIGGKNVPTMSGFNRDQEQSNVWV